MTASFQTSLGAFRRHFLRRDLRRKRERVDKEELGKTFQLRDFFVRQFCRAMGALISVQSNRVSPVLKVFGKSSCIKEGVDPGSERQLLQVFIKFARRNVERLSEHCRRRVVLLSSRIVDSLKVRPLDSFRCEVRRRMLFSLGVRIDYCKIVIANDFLKGARLLKQWGAVVVALVDSNASDVPASVTGKYCRDQMRAAPRCCNEGHADFVCETVGTVCDVSDRHVFADHHGRESMENKLSHYLRREESACVHQRGGWDAR